MVFDQTTTNPCRGSQNTQMVSDSIMIAKKITLLPEMHKTNNEAVTSTTSKLIRQKIERLT